MNRTLIATCTVVVTLLGLSGQARAGGFIIGEMDSRSAGRGNASAAVVDSPSVVFTNPGSVVALDGVNASAGFSVLVPRFRYFSVDGGDNAKTINQPSFPPNVFVTYDLGDIGFGELAAGFGAYVPYGASLKWPKNWEGRDELQEVGLTAWEFSPVLSLQPSEMFSVGVGLRILASDVYLRRTVPFGSVLEGDVELSGTGLDFGASAGVTIWGFENLTLALTWRSPAILHVRGQSDFDFPPPFDTDANDGEVRARVRLPQVFRIGAQYVVFPDELNLSMDIEFQQWSELQQIKIVFEDPNGTESIQRLTRSGQDSITVHVGGEYRVWDGLWVRAGYVFDEQILPDETLNPAPPDSHRHILSLGASYILDNWLGFHLHYSNVFFQPRESYDSQFPARYEGGHGGATAAFIAGLSVSAQFDVSPLITEPWFGEGPDEAMPVDGSFTPRNAPPPPALPAAPPAASDRAPGAESDSDGADSDGASGDDASGDDADGDGADGDGAETDEPAGDVESAPAQPEPEEAVPESEGTTPAPKDDAKGDAEAAP